MVLACLDQQGTACHAAHVAGSKDRALGGAVRQLRRDRGMTQEALAHTAGLALGTVTGVERATTAPDWATVRALAKALGVTMAELGAAIDAHD